MAGALRHPEPGGSRRLAGLLERYGEAIEADLAFLGVDLARLWRQRRWRLLLNLIRHLPRDSALADAVAQDDELAEQNVDLSAVMRPRHPPVSEFGPEVEALRDIYDRIGQLIHATVAVSGAKRPPKPRPALRPITATQRVRDRRAREHFDDIVALVTPHEANRDT